MLVTSQVGGLLLVTSCPLARAAVMPGCGVPPCAWGALGMCRQTEPRYSSCWQGWGWVPREGGGECLSMGKWRGRRWGARAGPLDLVGDQQWTGESPPGWRLWHDEAGRTGHGGHGPAVGLWSAGHHPWVFPSSLLLGTYVGDHAQGLWHHIALPL